MTIDKQGDAQFTNDYKQFLIYEGAGQGRRRHSVTRAAVLGSPIAHSLSPVLHRAAYAELGLDWTYEAIECAEAEFADLLPLLVAEGDWAGLSLTMPLKSVALALADEAAPVCQPMSAWPTRS